MTGGENDSAIARALDRVAGASCAAAVGYAVSAFLGGLEPILRISASLVAAVAAYALTNRALQWLAGESRLSLPEFEPVRADFIEDAASGELLLTESDRLPPPGKTDDEELLLDDVIASLGAGAQVIRLFDPARMPTAGELHERIGRHLRGESPVAAAPDATRDLYEALAALKSSLR